MRALIISFVLILAGCQYDPHTAVYTVAEPRPNDLVGTYEPDKDTAAFVTKEGHYKSMPPSISLMSNGTVIITNIPDWWLTKFGTPSGGFDSGSGTWTIGKHQRWWALSVSFPSTGQFVSQQHQAGGLSTEMMLIGEKPPYKIYLDVGDPDAGKGMKFERVSSKKAEGQ